MELQIIITVNFKGWSFEVYKEKENVKIHLVKSGDELNAAEWDSLTSTVNDAIQDTKTWKM